MATGQLGGMVFDGIYIRFICNLHLNKLYVINIRLKLKEEPKLLYMCTQPLHCINLNCSHETESLLFYRKRYLSPTSNPAVIL